MRICTSDYDASTQGFLIDLPFQSGLAYRVTDWQLSASLEVPSVFEISETESALVTHSVAARLIPLSGACSLPESQAEACCAAVDSIALPPIMSGCTSARSSSVPPHFFQQRAFVSVCGGSLASDPPFNYCLLAEVEPIKMTPAMERQLLELVLGPCPAISPNP